MSESLTLVKASCHCGLNTFQIPFATAKLPLATHMCHCNICRHTTGALAVHNALMDGKPLSAEATVESQTPADLSTLKTYNATDVVTRYFCGTCFSHILYDYRGVSPAVWMVATGALERVEGVVKVGYHCNVSSTRDGGLADHYRVLDGVEIPRYANSKKEGVLLPQGWRDEGLAAKKEKKEYLEAYCHCKNISLRIKQPNADEAADPAKWWAVAKKDTADPSARERHMCGHCLCASCRTAGGNIIMSAILLDKAHVFDAHTSLPISFIVGAEGRPKGLVRYESSKNVFREACGTCGACVFYWNIDPARTHIPKPDAEGQPVVIDVYAGLVDQDDGGARAEEWLFWYDQVINAGDAIDKPGMKALLEGVKPVA